MRKKLLLGLLSMSTLTLVACGSDDPVEEGPVEPDVETTDEIEDSNTDPVSDFDVEFDDVDDFNDVSEDDMSDEADIGDDDTEPVDEVDDDEQDE